MIALRAVEGVFVGGISYWYATAYVTRLVPAGRLGTLAAFAAMLVLYKTGVVRNSPRFQKTLIIAASGYLVFGLVNLCSRHVYRRAERLPGGGLLPVLISAFGVVLASFFLVLDFDFIEQGSQRLPQRVRLDGGLRARRHAGLAVPRDPAPAGHIMPVSD
jgi:uncharacterized YccA/Bax inhibitor family protein